MSEVERMTSTMMTRMEQRALHQGYLGGYVRTARITGTLRAIMAVHNHGPYYGLETETA